MSVAPISPLAAALRAQIVGAAEAELLATVGAILEASAAAADEPSAGAGRKPAEGTTARAPGAAVEAPRAPPAPPAAPPAPPLPALRAADSARAEAAGRQAGAAPLFAELAQALRAPATPASVKAAITQVLALQTPAAGPFTAQSVRQAVAQSGLFLEAHLAALPRGAAPPVDLKSALLTLRQALVAAEPAPPRPPTQATIEAAVSRVLALQTPAAGPAASPAAAAAPPAIATGPAAAAVPAAPIVAAPGVGESLRPVPAPPAMFLPASLATPPRGEAAPPGLKAALAVLQQVLHPAEPEAPASPAAVKAAIGQALAMPAAANGFEPAPAPAANPARTPAAGADPGAVPRPAAANRAAAPVIAATVPPATPTRPASPEALRQALAQPRLFLEAALAALPRDVAPPPEVKAALASLRQALGVAEPAPAPHTPTPPPPPSREGALTPQPVAIASLPASADAPTILHHLGREADQAIARQVLHQLASLPDRAAGGWMFELPIATPQGAAVAQFEIDRDGGAHPDAEPSWRVRFSIDIEPLGPVHVHLATGAGRAAVTVWAETEAGLARLRREADALAQALPADVVFHPGAPRRPLPRPGGFVDQAL